MKSAWENFQTDGIIDDILPESISASWIRSREAAVNPKEICLEANMFTEEQLQKSLEENKWIVEIVEPVMRELCRQFKNQRLTVILLDTDFCVLSVQQSDDDKLNKCNKPGFCYSEKNIGTTAVSMCVKSGKAEIVSGYEHYCKEFRDMFCVSIPIYDEKNKMCAILGTTGLLENKNSNLDTVLEIASRMITNSIKMHNVQKELDKQSNLHSLIIDAASDGMLTVDMNGIITFINPAGMRILNIDKSCIGKHITEGVDFEPTILHVVKTQKGYIDKEFRLESKRGTVHFLKTAIPMKDENGVMIGVLDIFRSINQVKSMVNKMTGAQAKYTVLNIIGESESMKKIKKMVSVAGLNDSAVLIQGESGTGKEIIAQAIHNYGSRREGPFVAINCAALPRTLIESELFGYEDGSFTGASKGGRPGKFEMANGGTLFLDEIGDMPLDIQSKLLRVLQQKAVVRVGGFKEIPIDVRIIAATNKNLAEMIKEKNFREDLYYRINVINIISPPLRDRENDIDLISDFILKQHNLVNGSQKTLSEETRKVLRDWSWPGNVRELENAIEYAYCISESSDILPEHLPNKISKGMTENNQNGVMSLKQAEIIAVKNALEHTGGNVTQAAKILGIGRNTLYDKIRAIGI
jgi:transcriptional regulator with PAS, ATPase and Fis domain